MKLLSFLLLIQSFALASLAHADIQYLKGENCEYSKNGKTRIEMIKYNLADCEYYYGEYAQSGIVYENRTFIIVDKAELSDGEIIIDLKTELIEYNELNQRLIEDYHKSESAVEKYKP